MAPQGNLNDAAIAVSKVLTEHGIQHGVFGGWAVATLGGPRESKDIDCLVATNRATSLDLLDKKHGFVLIPQMREDYVAFFWQIEKMT